MKEVFYALIKTYEELEKDGLILKEYGMPEGWGLHLQRDSHPLAKYAGDVVAVTKRNGEYFLVDDRYSHYHYKEEQIKELVTKETHPEYFL